MVRSYDDYSTNEVKKDGSPNRCDKCGGPACVYPFAHNWPRIVYMIKELLNPTPMYCDNCYYELMIKEHTEYTKRKRAKIKEDRATIQQTFVDEDYNGRLEANE